MFWDEIEKGLLEEVQRIVGTNGPKVAWSGQNDAGSGWAPSIYIELDRLSVTNIGRNEVRVSLVTVGGEEVIQKTLFGNRRFIIQVKVDTQEQTLKSTAMAHAVNLAAILEECSDLSGACLAVSDVRPIKAMDYCDCDGRQRSAVVFDLVLNTTCLVDCGTVPIAAKARVLGDVLYPDGSLALDDEVYEATTP